MEETKEMSQEETVRRLCAKITHLLSLVGRQDAIIEKIREYITESMECSKEYSDSVSLPIKFVFYLGVAYGKFSTLLKKI